MCNFWDHNNFNIENDKINLEIWKKSPKLQLEIQHPNNLIGIGSVGPQQAMLDLNPLLNIDSNYVLPWVPDLVGKDSNSDNGLLVYGAAYAGFIKEYSSRKACIHLSEYINAVKMKDQGISYFQRLFLDQVVSPDNSYYGKIKNLMQSIQVKSSQIILSDLCPNSIVKRLQKNGRRKDDSKQPSKDRAVIYCKYIENANVQEWTIGRILKNKSGRIIALGHIVEHGLLRLFHRMGATIYHENRQYNLPIISSPQWIENYADPNKQLSFWKDNNTWWTVRKGSLEWRILPIYHPAVVDRYDSQYLKTKEVLKNILS